MAATKHESNIVKQSQSMECTADSFKGADFIASSILVMTAHDVVGKNCVHTVHDEEFSADTNNGNCSTSSEMEMSRLPTWSSTAVMTASPPQFNDVGQLPTRILDDLPGMIRSVSGATSIDSDDDADTADEDDTMDTVTDDDQSSSSSSTASSKVKGVSFNESVRVLPIPPLSHYTLEQRRNMYANRFEVRENKLRNKKEYAFDNYDWKNCTEENSMVICPLSGNLLHPAHF